MAARRFVDRREAGRALAGLLQHHRGHDDVVVLGLARGGVPVAFEVARSLGARLDVLVVRKLGLPSQPELAMGAITGTGEVVLDDRVLRAAGVGRDALARVAREELQEVRRRDARYRGGRPPVDVTGQTAIVVDDGLATGSTMAAAVVALRHAHAARLVVAVPVAPRQTVTRLASQVDELVCAITPSSFVAVSQQYRDFAPTTDDEVCRLLRDAWSAEARAAPVRPPGSRPAESPGPDTA